MAANGWVVNGSNSNSIQFYNNTIIPAATTWNGGVSYVTPSSIRVELDLPPITPPTPKTEVDWMLGEVEGMCALAR